MEGYYTKEELDSMGFRHVGENVLLSKKTSVYGASQMSIGDHVRIDDFCLLVGKITLGSWIHVAAYTGLHASVGSIVVEDYSTLSSRCAVYAASDDYSGEYMTNSTVPEQYKHIVYSNIVIGKHVIIGTDCTILPGALVGEGVAVGAMSLIKEPLEPWQIYAGIPCTKRRARSRDLLKLESYMLQE